MKFFKRKKDSVLDLTRKRYNKKFNEKFRKDDSDELVDTSSLISNSSGSSAENSSDSFSPVPFFGDTSNLQGSEGDTFSALSSIASNSSNSEDIKDKKKKLGKRLKDITDRLEEISNSVYHLQQRVELIEKKMDVNKF